jgi:hypothetical protein
MQSKFKDYAIIGFLHFLCTFILALIVSYFIPGAKSIPYFWVAVGVGLGRFFLEWAKDKFNLKIK